MCVGTFVYVRSRGLLQRSTNETCTNSPTLTNSLSTPYLRSAVVRIDRILASNADGEAEATAVVVVVPEQVVDLFHGPRPVLGSGDAGFSGSESDEGAVACRVGNTLVDGG